MRFKALGLWYVLATAAIVARLALNRFVGGAWELTPELLVLVVAVPLVQVGVLLLLRKARAIA